MEHIYNPKLQCRRANISKNGKELIREGHCQVRMPGEGADPKGKLNHHAGHPSEGQLTEERVKYGQQRTGRKEVKHENGKCVKTF